MTRCEPAARTAEQLRFRWPDSTKCEHPDEDDMTERVGPDEAVTGSERRRAGVTSSTFSKSEEGATSESTHTSKPCG